MTTTQESSGDAMPRTSGSAPRFVQASSLEEALGCLAAGARPIAGGTDLVVAIRSGRSTWPESLVAIDRIAELSAISVQDSKLRIGAAVTHAQLMGSPATRGRYQALGDAAALIGSPATRNVGTLGGNIMNASPAADTAAPLLAAGALVEVASLRGVRQIPIADLWSGPGRTTVADDELCTAVLLDVDDDGAAVADAPRSSAYLRLEYRRSMEIAVVGAAASVCLAPDGAVAEIDVALSAVAPTVMALAPIKLDGRSPHEVGDAVAQAAREQAIPISDVRASDTYRKEMVAVMARRAVMVAARRAAGEPIGVPANRHLGIGVALNPGDSQ